MGTRLELQADLEALLGTQQVYFQPPESLKLTYPCIIYEIDRIDVEHANDHAYKKERSYSVTYIDRNPDNTIIDELSTWPYCQFDRFYVTENLNHYVFMLYY